MTRVSESARFALLAVDLERTTRDLAAATQRLSSGRAINRLSDAPELAVQADRLLSEDRALTAYSTAAGNARAWLATQDSALQSTVSVLSRVREVAISVVAATSAGTREGAAVELQGLRAQLVELANTSFDGRSVFGGFGSAAVQEVAGVVSYVGDGGLVQRRVGEQNLVQVNVSGSEVFGFDAGDDVFAVISDLIDNVRADDLTSVANSDQTRVQAASERLLRGLGTVGARGGQIDSVIDAADARQENVRAYRSSIVDADLAKTVLELTMAQNAYQAVLAATARLQLPTLIDFLR